MRITYASIPTPDRLTLQLEPGEIRSLRAALGEVCYGLRIDNFKGCVGVSEEVAHALFAKLDGLDPNRRNELVVSQQELVAIKNSHSRTLQDLGPEEYATRTGVDFEYGRALLERLERAIEEVR
jgi:hypothetical protein